MPFRRSKKQAVVWVAVGVIVIVSAPLCLKGLHALLLKEEVLRSSFRDRFGVDHVLYGKRWGLVWEQEPFTGYRWYWWADTGYTRWCEEYVDGVRLHRTVFDSNGIVIAQTIDGETNRVPPWKHGIVSEAEPSAPWMREGLEADVWWSGLSSKWIEDSSEDSSEER